MTTRDLPPVFAVFDCAPEWNTPFHKNRYALLRRVSGPGEPVRVEPHLLPEQGALPLSQPNCYPKFPYPVEFAGTGAPETRRTFWWFTGDRLFYDVQIPVVDFLRRDIAPFLFDTTATNDDVSWCIVRQIAQRSLRTRFEDRALEERVQRLPAIPLAPTAAGSPPEFVLKALLRDAEAQSEACPITQQKPSECGEVVFASCYHWFEKKGLETWMAGGKQECPVCKAHISWTKGLHA
jgi:hypothetical protein